MAAKRRFFSEPEPDAAYVPRRRLSARTRRDFLLFGAGTAAAALGFWWLMPDGAGKAVLPAGAIDSLDTAAARLGLTKGRRERVLNRALTFDDDVAEALYSRHRAVRTYAKSDITPLRNNYAGQTPGPGYLPTWTLKVSGLASGRTETLTIEDLLAKFRVHEQITRLVCVEGWSAVAWWGRHSVRRFSGGLSALARRGSGQALESGCQSRFPGQRGSLLCFDRPRDGAPPSVPARHAPERPAADGGARRPDETAGPDETGAQEHQGHYGDLLLRSATRRLLGQARILQVRRPVTAGAPHSP